MLRSRPRTRRTNRTLVEGVVVVGLTLALAFGLRPLLTALEPGTWLVVVGLLALAIAATGNLVGRLVTSAGTRR